jgi:hypothetical protein
MKTITVNVSEPVYKDFQQFARDRDRTTSELIREAMEEFRERRISPRPSLRGVAPFSVGQLREPILTQDDDLLEEMLGGEGR